MLRFGSLDGRGAYTSNDVYDYSCCILYYSTGKDVGGRWGKDERQGGGCVAAVHEKEEVYNDQEVLGGQ